MKRMQAAIAAMLLVAACGGSDSGTTTTGDGDGGTSGTTAGTTATTAAPTTTTASTDPVDARLAIAEAFAGDYEGTWMNTTFGSTGAIKISNSEVTDYGTLLLTLDVDGRAFGSSDPDPDLVEIELQGSGEHNVLGSFLGFGLDSPTLTFNDDGSWSLVATPDDLGGGELRVELTLTADGFEGTYEVTAPDGVVFAEGTFSATRAG